LPEEIAATPDQFATAEQALRVALSERTGLTTIESQSPGWIGLQCASDEMAIWLMRAVIVENILARREVDILFVPVRFGESQRHGHDHIEQSVSSALRLWKLHTAAER
jgi:sirohydrochlorin cobaltochelatase